MAPFRAFVAFLVLLGASVFAFGSSGGRLLGGAREIPAVLPFSASVAPGDVFVHDGTREINGEEGYVSRPMNAGDHVIGMGGNFRSAVLVGEATSVDVLPGANIMARQLGSMAYVDLLKGTIRLGRSSFGDGSRIRFMIRTGDVGLDCHGGDFMIARDDGHTVTVERPEDDPRFLFASKISLKRFVGGSSWTVQTGKGRRLSYSTQYVAPFRSHAFEATSKKIRKHAHHHHRHHHGRGHHHHHRHSASHHHAPGSGGTTRGSNGSRGSATARAP